MHKTASANQSYEGSEMDERAGGISKPGTAGARVSKATKEDDHYLGKGGTSRWAGEQRPGGWIRKLGYVEKVMNNAADFNTLSTNYILDFESRHRITKEIIEETCYIVSR